LQQAPAERPLLRRPPLVPLPALSQLGAGISKYDASYIPYLNTKIWEMR
jgi:hypothetical protein